MGKETEVATEVGVRVLESHSDHLQYLFIDQFKVGWSVVFRKVLMGHALDREEAEGDHTPESSEACK